MKFTHKDLIPIAYKWVLKNASCGMAFREFYTTNAEIPDVIGFGTHKSVLIECKASRSDFLKDARKPHRRDGKGMGMYRFYMCPAGLIKSEELPPRWGLIYVLENGKAKCIRRPHRNETFERDVEAEGRMMYSALRRMHLKGRLEEIYDKQYIYK